MEAVKKVVLQEVHPMYESMSAGQDGKELQSIVDEDMTTPGSGDSEQPLRWMELLSFNQAQQEER
jgi:hypothetical protein